MYNNTSECIASESNNSVINYPNPCFGLAENTPVNLLTIDFNAQDYLSITQYSANSYWYYLNEKIEKLYDDNGLNPVITTSNYFYDNPNHLQLTRFESVNGKGDVLKIKNYYPDDRSALSDVSTEAATAINKLKLQHRIANPIQGRNL